MNDPKIDLKEELTEEVLKSSKPKEKEISNEIKGRYTKDMGKEYPTPDFNEIENIFKEMFNKMGIVLDGRCKKCRGRGFTGYDVINHEPVLCKCAIKELNLARKKREEEKLKKERIERESKKEEEIKVESLDVVEDISK